MDLLKRVRTADSWDMRTGERSVNTSHLRPRCWHEFWTGPVPLLDFQSMSPSIPVEVCVSHSVVSDCLRPHGLYPARLLCPYYLPQFAQIYVHRVGNAIQPSHPLSPLLLLLSVFSSIRVFFNELALSSHSNEYSGLIWSLFYPIRITWNVCKYLDVYHC